MHRPSLRMAAAQGRRYVLATILPVVLFWVGCHNPDNFALNSDESPSIDRFFTLSTTGDTTLPADGVSTVELVAHVRDVSQGSVEILFTTTAGSLRVGTIVRSDSFGTVIAIRADSAVVQTDANGEARTELVSDSEQATAQVRARIVGIQPTVDQALRIHFAQVVDEDVLAFVDPPDSAFAHGLGLVPITVQIAPELRGDDRLVLFATTAGMFPFSLDASLAQIADADLVQVVKADADGFATAHLRTPEEAGDALVRATVLSFHQEHLIRFVPAPTDSILRFVDAPEIAPADGQSVSRFSVEISSLLQESQDRTVEFTTTLGSFVFPDSNSNGTTVSVLADADGMATATLRSPTTFEEAFVRANVKGFIQQRTLQFDWAGPDTIIVSTEENRLSMAITEQLRIEAELIRTGGQGQVTRDLEVTFTAVDSVDKPLPGARFVDVTRTDIVGQATATLVFDDVSLYEGAASILVQPARIGSAVVGRVELSIR